MRGMGHDDPIETVILTHAEGNEGEKIGVKRGFGAFYGAKLLKKQGETHTSSARTDVAPPFARRMNPRRAIPRAERRKRLNRRLKRADRIEDHLRLAVTIELKRCDETKSRGCGKAIFC